LYIERDAYDFVHIEAFSCYKVYVLRSITIV